MLQTSYQYANAVISDDYKDLMGIHLKSKSIAIYERNIDFLKKEINLIAQQPIECRASGTRNEILNTLRDYFDKNISESTLLFEDISEILRLFEKTTQASSFRLLLSTVSTNMCRKFHTDINKLRLLCTYMGPGTLWLPDEAVDEKALRRRGENHEIVRDESQIQQVCTGDIAILKGALYPDGNSILHRSPSIETDGETRLLLRIDINEFLKF